MVITQRERDTLLEDITTLTAAGFTRRLVPLVIRAYRTSRTPEEVLAAIEAGKVLGGLTPALLKPAWWAAHDWAWIARRRAFVAGTTRFAQQVAEKGPASFTAADAAAAAGR